MGRLVGAGMAGSRRPGPNVPTLTCAGADYNGEPAVTPQVGCGSSPMMPKRKQPHRAPKARPPDNDAIAIVLGQSPADDAAVRRAPVSVMAVGASAPGSI